MNQLGKARRERGGGGLTCCVLGVGVQVNERTGRPLSKKEIRDLAKKSKKAGK